MRAADAEEHRHRSEDLFLRDLPRRVDSADHGGSVERPGSLEPLAAREHARSGLREPADLIVDRVDRLRVHERTYVCLLIHRISDDERLEALDHDAFELVRDTLVQDESLRGD